MNPFLRSISYFTALAILLLALLSSKVEAETKSASLGSISLGFQGFDEFPELKAAIAARATRSLAKHSSFQMSVSEDSAQYVLRLNLVSLPAKRVRCTSHLGARFRLDSAWVKGTDYQTLGTSSFELVGFGRTRVELAEMLAKRASPLLREALRQLPSQGLTSLGTLSQSKGTGRVVSLRGQQSWSPLSAMLRTLAKEKFVESVSVLSIAKDAVRLGVYTVGSASELAAAIRSIRLRGVSFGVRESSLGMEVVVKEGTEGGNS